MIPHINLINQGRKEIFIYRCTQHILFSYMGLTLWLRARQIVREETCYHHYMGYSFLIAARVLSYAPSLKQESTSHGLYYSSRGALAWTRNSSMGPPWGIDPTTHCTILINHALGNSLTTWWGSWQQGQEPGASFRTGQWINMMPSFPSFFPNPCLYLYFKTFT